MHTCDACGEEFETLSELRLRHDPCPVEEDQRRREEAVEWLADERAIEIGDVCRVVKTGEEVTVVDVEPAEEEDAEPTVVWVPADQDDESEHRQRSSPGELV